MNQIPEDTPESRWTAMRRRAEDQRRKRMETDVPKIHIGLATCGIASGALDTKQAFEQALAEQGIEALIHTVGCGGHCYGEPVVVIDHPQSGFPPAFPGWSMFTVPRWKTTSSPR